MHLSDAINLAAAIIALLASVIPFLKNEKISVPRIGIRLQKKRKQNVSSEKERFEQVFTGSYARQAPIRMIPRKHDMDIFLTPHHGSLKKLA